MPDILDTHSLQEMMYGEGISRTAIASVKRLKTVGDTIAMKQRPPQARSDKSALAVYRRMGNKPVMVPTAKYNNAPPTKEPYDDVREKDGHTCLPSLLRRYWSDSSQGDNSAIGFKSGRSKIARAPPRGPPLCKDVEWTDVLEHLNPNSRPEHRIPSPFISTSSRLIWLVHQALQKESKSTRISVIQSSALDSKGVYYVPPFHGQLHKRLAFDNLAHRYKGSSEHLVWNEIGPSALIKTVFLEDFQALELRNRDFDRLLRLKNIKAECSLHELTRVLKRDCIKIINETAVVIAELVMFFGLDHTSCEEVLSRLVYEIA
jgi:hypothetical protein